MASKVKPMRNPMLAARVEDWAPTFPGYVQPKLDGLRAVYADGTFSSRTQKPLPGALTTLRAELAAVAAHLPHGVALDGELYVHGMPLATIQSAVRHNEPSLEYWVYDLVDARRPFAERHEVLRAAWDAMAGAAPAHVRLVPTTLVHTAAAWDAAFARALRQGYEGIMWRSPTGVYEPGKRSRSLLKRKRADSAEFRVVGYKEAAHGGVVWECEVAPGGPRFGVNPLGSLTEARAAVASAPSRVGTWLTVTYQGTLEDGTPRNARAVAFRDASDWSAPPLAHAARRPRSPSATTASTRACKRAHLEDVHGGGHVMATAPVCDCGE